MHEGPRDNIRTILSLKQKFVDDIMQKGRQPDKTPIASRCSPPTTTLSSRRFRDKRVVPTNVDPTVPLVFGVGRRILEALDVGQAVLAEIRYVIYHLLLCRTNDSIEGPFKFLNAIHDRLPLLLSLGDGQPLLKDHFCKGLLPFL